MAQLCWRGYPVHALIVRVYRKIVDQTGLVNHAHTQGRGGGQEAVIESTAKSQPPAAAVKGHARHQHKVDISWGDSRQVGRGFEHTKVVANQAIGIVRVEDQPLPYNTGDNPGYGWYAFKESA
jgi:hypothetical protein